MATQNNISPHPVFQACESHRGFATDYLLWMISRKVFIKPSGCWCWGGRRSDDGYGLIELSGKIHRVTRVLYEHCIGPFNEELLVLHHCDHPPCVRLDHLYLGNHQDNALDCLRRGRHPLIVLNDDLVKEILAKYASGWRVKTLAERFGVSVSAIQDVVSRRTWKHVGEGGAA